jgi:hypothetical protein
MTRSYILYVLTLISSFATCFIIGSLLTVTLRVDTLSRISFEAGLLQFGLGSWLFLQWPKIGRWLAIILGILLLIWLVSALSSIIAGKEIDLYAAFGILTILSSLVIYLHVSNIRNTERPGVLLRTLLALLPIGLVVYYLIDLNNNAG